MDEQISYTDRIRYNIDNIFSRGAGAVIAVLGFMTLVVAVVASLIIIVAGITESGQTTSNFGEALWQSLMHAMNSGTLTGDVGWAYRTVMFFVTMFGIFVTSILIGVLTSSIRSKLDELRKGRSRVIEKGHTVILGWSEQIFTIISELVIANENQPKSTIVILGNRDKVEMDDEIREKVGNTGSTRIVCRTGDLIEMSDLSLVSINTARSIIILPPEGNEPDSSVIKTVLAITSHPKRRREPYHIVAEIRQQKNIEIAKVVGKDEVEWIRVEDVVARVIAQTCRQAGLSSVYAELLDFGNDEIYFYQEPKLVGKTFGEALLAFEKNTVLGLCMSDKAPKLNPPMDYELTAEDVLIVIAEDDDMIVLDEERAKKNIREDLISDGRIPPSRSERTLILGWNWRAPAIINELDHYVSPRSRTVIFSDREGVEEQIEWGCPGIKRQKITVKFGDTTDRRMLDAINLSAFDHVILLSPEGFPVQQADARTLITLLHLRDIADFRKCNFSIVSEMLDVRNRELADVTRADDFIMSDKLISLMMAQISENKKLNAVFTDLFDPDGSEIYFKPISAYVHQDTPVNFYTVVEAARRRGEAAIGYHLHAYSRDARHMYGVVINPHKSDDVVFTGHDRLIVLADG